MRIPFLIYAFFIYAHFLKNTTKATQWRRVPISLHTQPGFEAFISNKVQSVWSY